MKISIPFLFLILLAPLPLTVAAAEPEVIYWNSDAGKALRARIAPDEDYWQLIPWFTEQVNQTYCGEARWRGLASSHLQFRAEMIPHTLPASTRKDTES